LGGEKFVLRTFERRAAIETSGKAKCPACGSENVKSELSFTNIVEWAAKLLGVPTVKIFEKKCVECGH
jgi:predicted nucleic-acid-binding Zn-ribbon protein